MAAWKGREKKVLGESEGKKGGKRICLSLLLRVGIYTLHRKVSMVKKGLQVGVEKKRASTERGRNRACESLSSNLFRGEGGRNRERGGEEQLS